MNKKQSAELIGRGDVITVKPDGWPWSKAARENPKWAVVQMDILPVEAKALVCPEMNPSKIKPYCNIRQHKLDLDRLGVKKGNHIQKGKKIQISTCMIHKGTACAK